MTWPNWNWESLENLAVIFGVIFFLFVWVRFCAFFGIGRPNLATRSPDSSVIERLNPSTGLTMHGGTDSGGSLYGEEPFSDCTLVSSSSDDCDFTLRRD
jgi:hypothetical protein